MTFIIKGPATLKAINLRAEGGEDNRHAAFDLKLECVVHADAVGALMGADDLNHFGNLFWRDDDGRNRRFFTLGALRIEGVEVKDIRAKLLTGIAIDGCTAKGFKWTPLARGYADLSFTLRCSYPPKHAASLLHEYLGETLTIELSTVQQQLFDRVPTTPVAKPDHFRDATKKPTVAVKQAAVTDSSKATRYERAVAHVRAHGCSPANLASALVITIETAEALIQAMLKRGVIKAEHNMYIVLNTKPRAKKPAKVAP